MPLRMGLPASHVDVPQPRLARTHHTRKTTIGLRSGFDRCRVYVLHQQRDGPLHRRIGFDLMPFQVIKALGERSLGGERAFAQGFDDLKRHQIKTYAAMQRAVTLLMKDVDPAAIEAASQSDRGLAGMVGSRKARLWDIYVARWQAHAQRHDNGILDTFMDYFARCYEGESK